MSTDTKITNEELNELSIEELVERYPIPAADSNRASIIMLARTLTSLKDIKIRLDELENTLIKHISRY